jgi:uncharacterized protein YcbX
LPGLKSITIFPIKSLDGVELKEAIVLKNGALKNDREFALFTADMNVVNGKQYSAVHLIRAFYKLEERLVTLEVPGKISKQTFHLDLNRKDISKWFSNYFGFDVKFEQNSNGGFPDDAKSPGPTIVSTESLKQAQSWFQGITYEKIRARVRANLEIEGGGEFWEDRLFGKINYKVIVRIGSVHLEGINPCARCVVLTRDPWTGEEYKNFQKRFIRMRKKTLPKWAVMERFDHFYKFAVNTKGASEEGIIKVGDQVVIENNIFCG